MLIRNTSANCIHSKHFCQLYSFETLSSAWATQKYQLTSTCCRRFSSRLLCSFQPHRNGFVRELRFGAARAEVATKTALEICDAMAPRCLFAWLFAPSEVGDFARWLVPVDLTSARVAFDVGAGILPRALRGCGFYEWSVFDVLHAWWVCCKGIRANTPWSLNTPGSFVVAWWCFPVCCSIWVVFFTWAIQGIDMSGIFRLFLNR